MAGNGIGDQFSHPSVSASQAKLQDLLRAGGRMIDAARTAADISLICFRIFSKVMQPAGERGGLRCTKLAAE